MKEHLLALNYNPKVVEILLDDRQHDNQELMLDKIQGSKVVVYSRSKVPLLFSPDPKINAYYPTVYTMLQMRESGVGILGCFLKTGVESYIFNGADLMWPGIKAFSKDDFRLYDPVIIFAKNQNSISQVSQDLDYVPIAVGKMVINKIPENLKGKAIEIQHYLYDELWNMGPKKIPEEIRINQEPSQDQQPQGEGLESANQSLIDKSDSQVVLNEELKSNNQEEEKKSYEIINDQITSLEEEKVTSTTTQTLEQSIQEEEGLESKVTPDEMDSRFLEAFFRSIYEDIQDSDLPLEPSDLVKDFLNFYADPNFKLDFRGSSYKRIGKFLEIMHKRGIIDYSEPKGLNHKVITRIHRTNEELKNYTPIFSLRKSKKPTLVSQGGENLGGLSSIGYPKVEINEVFQLDKNLNCVLQNVKEISRDQKYFNLKEIRDLLQAYVRENDLENGANKGFVKLDPILAQIIVNKKVINSDKQVTKDNLFKAILDHVIDWYQVVQIDQSELIKDRVKYHKGEIPSVKVQAKRVQNKKQTVITGLELYQIDYDELVSYLQNKCACSVTTADIEGQAGAKYPKQEVLIQGNHLDLVSKEILVKRYCVPEKYIIRVDDIKGKGKGKKK